MELGSLPAQLSSFISLIPQLNIHPQQFSWLCPPIPKGRRTRAGGGPGRGNAVPASRPVALTFIAVGVEFGGGGGEAGAVGELVEGPDARGLAAAFPAREPDGVADAAVGQPAWVALVQALTPRQVELSRGGQRSPPAPAVPLGPLPGEPPRHRGVKHRPCKRAEPIGDVGTESCDDPDGLEPSGGFWKSPSLQPHHATWHECRGWHRATARRRHRHPSLQPNRSRREMQGDAHAPNHSHFSARMSPGTLLPSPARTRPSQHHLPRSSRA